MSGKKCKIIGRCGERTLGGQSTHLLYRLARILRLVSLSATVAIQQSPASELARNDSLSIRQIESETTITWIGHATVLIQIDEVNILTDPIWSDRAWPVFGPKRVSPPGVEIDSLPNIHVVVISHNHFDHLDSYSLERIWTRDQPLFLVPTGVKKWFDSEGIGPVQELGWWDAIHVKGISFFCVPAAHRSSTVFFSKRDESDLSAGWVVCGQTDTIYFAGDTDYFDGFKKIGQRYFPIHVALLPIAPTVGPHLHGQRVVQAFLDLRARYLIPIHWGTFEQDIVPGEAAIVRFRDAVEKSPIPGNRVLMLRHGVTLTLSHTKHR